MINLLLLIYIYSPFALIAILAFYGIRLYKDTSTARRVTGIAFSACAAVGLLMLAFLYNHAKGFGVLAVPVLALASLALAFSIIWALLIIVFFIDKKISKDYFGAALIMLSLSGFVIHYYIKHDQLPIKAAKGEISQEEIHHWLDLHEELRYKKYPWWLRDSLDGALNNPKLSETILSDYIEHKYSNVDAIVRHPDMTPELLEKMYDKGYSVTDIANNRKITGVTLSRMYKESTDFYSRGHIVNHANAPAELSTDFVNSALDGKEKDHAYWAIANTRRIPAQLFKKLSKDDDWKMRLAVTNNYYAPVDIIEKLAEDKDGGVIYGARENLRLRDSVRKQIEEK